MTPYRTTRATAGFSRLLGMGIAASGLGFSAVLMTPRIQMWKALGAVCGHHGLAAAVHCPACYVALAMMISGAALAASDPAPVLAPLRAKRPRTG